MSEIKRQAVTYLSYREYGANELCRKLSLRFGDIAEIQKVVMQLTTEGLQCDLRFAHSCIESRVRRGYGRIYIENLLQHKRLTRETVSRAFDECVIDWENVIVRAWQKKFSANPPQDVTEKARQTRFLLNRGFTNMQIKIMFGKITEEFPPVVV